MSDFEKRIIALEKKISIVKKDSQMNELIEKSFQLYESENPNHNYTGKNKYFYFPDLVLGIIDEKYIINEIKEKVRELNREVDILLK